jgi:uncharacterized protein YbjT (DUF2867 family)
MTIAKDLKDKLKHVAKKINPSPASRKKVIVIGSKYHVGEATLLALTSLHNDAVQAYAGTEDKIKNPVDLEGVQTVQTNLADPAGLARSLVGYDAAYIVVPGHSGGIQLTLNGIQAAKEADVKFLLLMSVISQNSDESTFEEEFQPIRDAVEESGMDYTIVRLPLDAETPVAVGDAGKAAAEILSHPSKHAGKEYKLETAQAAQAKRS